MADTENQIPTNVDAPVESTKSKKGGGHNGHNGLKSIDSYIGKDYHRIKIGVGRHKIMIKEKKDELISKWVLSDFQKIDEEKWLKKILKTISQNFSKFFSFKSSKF